MEDLFEKFKEYVKNNYNMDVVRSDDGITINDIFSDEEESEKLKTKIAELAVRIANLQNKKNQ
ncbi:MAG: hypothetical protein J6V44_13135 [Methanobrevibacter sp.]|nr:hypothetical protein [Methanobrevibacter sp.]